MYTKRAWTAYSRTKTEAPKHSATAQSWTKLLKWSEFDSAAAVVSGSRSLCASTPIR